MTSSHGVVIVILGLVSVFYLASCDLEPTFTRCCTLGSDWFESGKECKKFPAPVAGVSAEQQSICLSAVEICCLRSYRHQQCINGKGSAKSGNDCIVTKEIGGEYHKDCCEACKLGIISASMNMGCQFETFSFGLPWDKAYLECCVDEDQFVPPIAGNATRKPATPVIDNLCNFLEGELCAHICVPTPGSYRCECREGFSLMSDGKSCQQKDLPDRCKLNNPCSHKCLDTGIAIECSCHPGYELGQDERSCLDIDECSLHVDTCDPNFQICKNEHGKYVCVNPDGSVERPHAHTQPGSSPGSTNAIQSGKCPVGYQYNSKAQVCDDIDECQLKLDNCESDSSCQNNIGSFTCIRAPMEDCPPGYIFKSSERVCHDINECEEGLDNCDQNTQLCINTEGSFHCEIKGGMTQCPAGYKMNKEQRKCEDVDECKENLHSCMDETEICRNNIGAYECDIKCKAGFLYDIELRSCVDVDECFSGTHNCGKLTVCVNTIGSFQCVGSSGSTCPAGFKNSANPGTQCEDVDECREGLHACEDNEDCFNEEGSYRCEQKQRNNEKCPLGYSYSVDRKACLDVNECLTDQHNCTTASGEICVNIQGSFLCQMRSCPQGFTFNTRLTSCDDVDECVTGQHNCSASEGLECVNLIGSFQCKIVSCREGFRLNTITSQCEDLDECVLNTANCSPGEKCINEIGGFWCNPLCGSGYKINPDDSASCLDIDECQEGIDNCNKKTNICKNTEGGFVCEALPQCLPGFKLNNNQCEDIDECAENLHRCNTNSQLCVNTVGSFHCRTSYRPPQRHCARGFQIDQQTNVCVDVNECERGEYYCRDEEECVNSPGSYRCMFTSNNVVPGEQCPAGFRYNHTRTQCLDIDECFEKIHVCNLASEACINEPGGYRCGAKSGQDKQPTTDAQKCPPGFREHPVTKSCVDVDECAENEESPCDSNQDCTNTQGGYTCSCKYGFLLDQTLQACVDVNECQVNSHNCLPTQRCDNTIGSFQCIRFTSCGTGYTLNAETGDCEDDNECQLGSDNCQALGPIWVCRNTPGSFRCERKLCGPKQTLLPSGDCKNAECSVGFESNEQGQCKDINECQLPTTCQRNQRCFNTIGSYRCINLINCGGGYALNTEGTQCVDIDECAQGTHDCGRGQICQNRQGGYLCQCPTGYTTNQLKECVDIDECTRYAGQVCAVNSVCQNTPGSYQCQCKNGFKQEEGSKSCLDIDECKDSSGICHQTCINNWGSYRCSCNSGYTLQHDNRSCHDVDECEQFKDRNLCVGICVNQPGSYSCKCPDGYRLGSDGRTCQDEDECLAGNVCDHPDDVCINTRGGYRCNTISCPSNFVKETEHKNRCRRISSICREGDTNCLNTPGSYSFNFITFVSNLAIPPVGQLDLFTMRGPLWSTTTVSFTLDMLDSRAPIGIERATKEHFRLRRTSHNQAVISLIKKITGPQEIELQLTMKMYHSAGLGGSAVARLFIYVSQYEF